MLLLYPAQPRDVFSDSLGLDAVVLAQERRLNDACMPSLWRLYAAAARSSLDASPRGVAEWTAQGHNGAARALRSGTARMRERPRNCPKAGQATVRGSRTIAVAAAAEPRSRQSMRPVGRAAAAAPVRRYQDTYAAAARVRQRRRRGKPRSRPVGGAATMLRRSRRGARTGRGGV